MTRAAVPFEEDAKDPSVWFLDRDYLEDMFLKYKKVNGERAGLHHAIRDFASVAP